MAQLITNVADFDKEVLQSTVPVLVDFFAPWCGPCQMLLPTIDELSTEVQDAKVVKVNVDEVPELAQKYGVMSIPSLKIFKGGVIVKEMMGVQPKGVLVSALNAVK